MQPDHLALKNLPPIATLLKTQGLLANKQLGQHFLFDLNITDKIVRSAGDLSGETILEIGPGPGGLTRSILEYPVKEVIAIETDLRFVNLLNDYLKPASSGRLTILNQDALKFDYASIGNKFHIIANLPYQVATPLLCLWLEHIQHIHSMTLMFQKEVAERIAAKPSSKAYGRLSVMAQYLCQTDILFDLPATVFYPPPKVASSVIQIIPHPTPLSDIHPAHLEAILRITFGQRRKTLRATLKSLTPDANDHLIHAGINPDLRPEALDVAEFCQLTRAFLPYVPKLKN